MENYAMINKGRIMYRICECESDSEYGSREIQVMFWVDFWMTYPTNITWELPHTPPSLMHVTLPLLVRITNSGSGGLRLEFILVLKIHGLLATSIFASFSRFWKSRPRSACQASHRLLLLEIVEIYMVELHSSLALSLFSCIWWWCNASLPID